MRYPTWRPAAFSIFLALAAAGAVLAQTTGGGGSTGGGGTGAGSGGTTGGGATSRPTVPTNPTIPSARTPTPEMRRPIFLQGKVMIDDGTPPPDPAIIELVCNGRPRPQGYTDSKGHFGFELGASQQSMMSDASYGSTDSMGASRGLSTGVSTVPMGVPGAAGSQGYTERDLMGCELRANLAGFRADPVSLSGRRSLDNPEVGTIILHRLANVQGFTYSMTTASAPKDAKKAYEKGLDALKKNKPADAEAQFAKAVELYPKFAIAWNDLGHSQTALNKLAEAKKSFDEAAKLDDHFVKPYLELSELSFREKAWPEVLDYTTRVIKLDPYSYPGIYFMNAVANLQTHQLDAAEKSAREALKLDTDHRYAKTAHVLGVILAQKEEYPAALEYMKGYLALRPDGPDADYVKKQIADLEKAVGTGEAAQAKPSSPAPPEK